MSKYIDKSNECECMMGTLKGSAKTLGHGFDTYLTAMDHIPIMNIPPFGQCKLSPVPHIPCIPKTSLPWIMTSSTVIIKGVPVLTEDSKCICLNGGIISIKQK